MHHNNNFDQNVNYAPKVIKFTSHQFLGYIWFMKNTKKIKEKKTIKFFFSV